MEKTVLRKEILQRRSDLPAAERERLSQLAESALIQSEPFGQAGMILLYAPFRGEVGTDLIATAARMAGKRLALPRVQKEPRRLWLHAYSGDPASLVKGAYGIREPEADWPLVEPGAVDLVVVPGVGFDPAGHRLGYGGGFYDRLLPEIRQANPQAHFCGLAYSLQLVSALPADVHDVGVDSVATEHGFAAVARSRGERG